MAKGDSGGGTTTSTYEMSDEQQRLFKDIIPIAQQYLKNPPELPGYSQIQPFNKDQLAAQKMLLDQIMPMQMETARGLQGANQFMLSGDVLKPGSNPALQQYMDAASRPITQNLMESVLPGLRGEATSAGQYGSSRQGIAEGLASGRASQAIGQTTSGIANQGYQSGLDSMIKAMGLAPQSMQAMTMPAMTQSAVGQQNYNMAQSLLSERAYGDMYKQMAPFLAAEQVARLAQGIPGGTAISTASTPQMPWWQQMMGGAMGGGAAGLGMGMGPWGAAGGAGLGALMSLF